MIYSNKIRIAATALLALAMVSPAAAGGFGSFALDSQKKIDDLEAEFGIGLVNLDNVSRKIILDAEEKSGYRVVFGENPVLIQPSRVSSTPEGDGRWFSLGSRYAEVKRIDFRVLLNESADRRRFSIPVTVAAVYSSPRNLTETFQSAYQVRTHVFHLETTSQNIMPTAENIYGGGSLWSPSPGGKVNGGSGKNTSVRNRAESTERNTSEERQEKGLTQRHQEGNEEINRWTPVFLIGAAVSIGYLLKELLL
ncbi:MAG: hypothetical protein ABEJ36_01475 [Candidatus Nanosalina sp.]